MKVHWPHGIYPEGWCTDESTALTTTGGGSSI